jgi:hypothetical protein
VRESTTPKHYTDDEKKAIFQRFSNSEYCKKSPAGPPIYGYQGYTDEVYDTWEKFLQRVESPLREDLSKTSKYRGYVIHNEDGVYNIYTREEWSQGKGYRNPEWSADSREEAEEWIDGTVAPLRESISKVFKPTTK